MLSVKRLIAVSRPLSYIPAMVIYVIGIHSYNWHDAVTGLGLLFFTLPFGLIAYGINDISDRESDLKNPRKGGVDGAILTEREVTYVSAAIIVAIVSFVALFLAFGRIYTALAILLLSSFCYIYSAKPIRLKTRPVLDSLSNGIIVALVYTTGYTINSPHTHFTLPSLTVISAIILCAAAAHAYGAVLDYDVDRQVGDNTICVALGKTKTLTLCALAFAGAFFLVGQRHPAFGAFLLLSILMSLVSIKYNSPKATRRFGLILFLLLPVALLIR